jgi:hypothetical protein
MAVTPEQRESRRRELVDAGMDHRKAAEVVAIEAGDADGCCLPARDHEVLARAGRDGGRLRPGTSAPRG